MGILSTKIAAAFAKIGTTNGTAPPTDDNLDLVAHELLVSRELSTMADKRKETAKKAAVAAKLISADEQPVGAQDWGETTSYNIEAKTASPREMIDPDKLHAAMVEAGLTTLKAAQIIVASKKMAKAATTWNVVPKANG